MRKETTVVVNGNLKENLRKKTVLAIAIVVATVFICVNVFSIFIVNNSFAKETDEFYKLNQNTIFSIDKIYLYSSASATENKENRPIWNINLFEYTDIAIYINNRSDTGLTNENTIKELYIDNIKFGDVKLGTQSLYYKDINDFGKSLIKKNEETSSSTYDEAANSLTSDNEVSENNSENSENTVVTADEDEGANKDIPTLLKNEIKVDDKLNYTILNDGEIDYSKPEIYADGTNPISLEYINSNIKENQIISDISSDITYDGSLLRKASVVLSDISSYVSFNINIINLYGQKFVANVFIEIPLEDTVTGDTIYNGKFVKKIENANYIKFFRTE